MKKILKRSSVLLLMLVILLSQFSIKAAAATLPGSLYIQQATNVSCTRASNTMMLRARAYLSGNDNWSSISENDLTNCGAWTAYGLLRSYSLNKAGMSFSVNQASVNGLSLASLRSILNAHPEGVAMYWNRLPHCIFVTDIQGDTVYASDPGWGYSHARRPITSSYIGYRYGSQANILANVTSYWYITSYNVPSSSNSPIGYIDTIASAGEGKIRVTGWTLDKDQPTTSLEVHVFIGGGAGVGEGHVIKANISRNDIASANPGAGSAHGFDAVISTNKTGNQAVYAYAINVGSGSNTLLNNSGRKVNIISDTTKPTISNVKVSNVTTQGYTVTCNVSDNVGVTQVQFPTWTQKDGQDDVVWHNATISGNTATFNVKIGDHKNEFGAYTTHIYARDAKGNSASAVAPAVNVPAIAGSKKATGAIADGWYIIGNSANPNYVLDAAGGSTKAGTNVQLYLANKSDAQIWYIRKLSDGTYSIHGRKSERFINVQKGGTADGTNILIYGQGTPNAQEKWTITANSDGTYTFVAKCNNKAMTLDQCKLVNGRNVLCWSNKTAPSQRWVLFPVDLTPPSITNVKVTEVSASGYRVTCNVSDASGINRVQFPTWTEKDGQDDIVWHNATVSGNTATFYVKVSDHKNGFGTYKTHIYAWDNSGNKASFVAPQVVIPTSNKSPIGCVDSVTSAGAGKIRITGWALDTDQLTTSLEVHVYIGGGAGAGEGHVIKANISRNDIASAYPGAGSAHGFDAVISTNKVGNQAVYAYAINVGGGSNTELGGSNCKVNIVDGVKPAISNVKVSNITSNGYTVTCTVSDNVGVTKVLMPTWTNSNGQDDIVWHSATISGNTATFNVKIDDHKNEAGAYITNIYAYDAANNRTGVEVPTVTVPAIAGSKKATGAIADGWYVIGNSANPNYVLEAAGGSTIAGTNVQLYLANLSDAQVWYIRKLSDGTYSIHGKKSERFINVQKGGTADGTNILLYGQGTPSAEEKWIITANSDGTYTFVAKCNNKAMTLDQCKLVNGRNVLCWSNKTAPSQRWVLFPADTTKPTITNVKVSNVTAEGYTVTCTVSDNVGVAQVQMPTWTSIYGQDDVVWHNATISGDTATFNVKVSDHKYEAGEYITHIYVKDRAGNQASIPAPNTMVPVNLTPKNDLTFRIATAMDTTKGLNISGASTASEANLLLWSYNGGANQKFTITDRGNGYYSISAGHSGLVLDVSGGSNANGTNVRQFAYNGSAAQLWRFEDAGNGYVYIVSKVGAYLDLSSGATANGTNIQIYSGNKSNAQKWKLSAVEKPSTAKGYAAGYSGGMAGTGSIRAYGIDVSEHQGAGFNFQNLKNAGYSFVILRCGFVTRKDNRFEEYYAAAKAAGLDVGVYFYSYAENASEASYEADRCLSYIKGKKFEYPVYFDFEDPCANSRDGNVAYSICRTFLDKIAAAGYLTGLYGYAGWIDPNYGAWVPASSICGGKYECWIANYYNHSPTNVKSAQYPSTYGMYQYTSSNYVNGVGPLDTNVVYKDYPTIVKTYHFNGY